MPFVDGRRVSSDDLRADVARLDDERRRRVEELREEVSHTVGEITARLNLTRRVRERRALWRPAALTLLATAMVVVGARIVRRRAHRAAGATDRSGGA